MNAQGRTALNVINAVDGYITIVDGSNSRLMDKNETWPGIEQLKVQQDLAGR